MKKAIAIILSICVVFSGFMFGCSKADKNQTSAQDGLEANADEYLMDGDDVYKLEDGEYYLIDENGDIAKDEKGKKIKLDPAKAPQANKDKVDNGSTSTDKPIDLTPSDKLDDVDDSVFLKPFKEDGDEQLTTLPAAQDKVPATSASGSSATLTERDQTAIINMLQVPYLYLANYENTNGVPTEIAAYAAIWMANREGLNTSTFASGTVVLDLFKFFGQTVVNFKTRCNGEKGSAGIQYNTGNDTFYIPDTNLPTAQTVTKITKIEYLGNNNYYKISANISNAGGKSKVVAVVQKNQLDTSLGFSIKALQWS